MGHCRSRHTCAMTCFGAAYRRGGYYWKELCVGNTVSLAFVALGLLSCSPADGQRGTMSPLHPSKPLSAITNAASFRAVVIGKLIGKPHSESAIVELQMPDKSIFSVGQTKATPIEIDFLSTLEVGHEYSFPDVFTEWQSRR